MYHAVKHDTARIIAIDLVCDNLIHRDWKKYQEIQYLIIKKGLENSSQANVKSVLNKYYGGALNNLGTINLEYGNIKKALDFYYQSLEHNEKIGDQTGVASSLTNLGLIYYEQGDVEKSLESYQKAIKISRALGKMVGVIDNLSNIARVYYDKEEYQSAIDYLNQSKLISDSIGYMTGVSKATSNLGGIYKMLGNNEKALEMYHEGLKLEEANGDKLGVGGIIGNIGLLYYEMGNLPKARKYGERSLAIAKEISYAIEIKNGSKLMSKIYKDQGNYKDAMAMYELFIQMRDSLKNEEIQTDLIKKEAKYEYEKRKAIDDAAHEKQIAIEHEEKEKQQILTTAVAVGLGFAGIFLIVLFNRLKVTRKQKSIIEAQKDEVEIAHTELAEKNREITDSIQYAKRIQSAILPPAKMVKEYLKESFILYKPKDVVAGDFYWMEHTDNKVLFAVADCTGHGVPGAMVSVVCNNALNRSVREHGLTDPGAILTKTREIVIQEFEKSEEEVKDGMDIALCSLDENKLQYAGAHNPLWIIRDGEIIETKANKQPIGQFDNPEPYTTHSFDLEQGDSLYIFSDGYVDQFGGEKGKKFKTKAFRELLLSIQDKSMEDQKTIIDKAFETWRGNLDQIDDVCVIGVRV